MSINERRNYIIEQINAIKDGERLSIPEEEAFDVPQLQKDEVLKRIEKYKNNPEQLIDEDAFFAMLNED